MRAVLSAACPSCRPAAGLCGPKTHQHLDVGPGRAAQDDHAVGGESRFFAPLCVFSVPLPLLECADPSRAARHHGDGASVQHERVQRPAAALRFLSHL